MGDTVDNPIETLWRALRDSADGCLELHSDGEYMCLYWHLPYNKHRNREPLRLVISPGDVELQRYDYDAGDWVDANAAEYDV